MTELTADQSLIASEAHFFEKYKDCITNRAESN